MQRDRGEGNYQGEFGGVKVKLLIRDVIENKEKRENQVTGDDEREREEVEDEGG